MSGAARVTAPLPGGVPRAPRCDLRQHADAAAIGGIDQASRQATLELIQGGGVYQLDIGAAILHRLDDGLTMGQSQFSFTAQPTATDPFLAHRMLSILMLRER